MPTPASALVHADGRTPERWMLFLHGILGRGGNLRVIARRVVTARPAWGVALVDLRMHGASQGFPPPHGVAAAARDLLALDAVVPGPIRGVLGHSFGGKVALEYLRLRADSLAHVFTVDSAPSTRVPHGEPDLRDSPTREVIRILESLPPLLPVREALVDRAVAAGLSRSLGEWLAMNLERHDGGWRLILDLAAIRAMLEDYFVLDQWPLVEALPGEAKLHAIIGDRSGVWRTADRERLARAAAAQPGRIDRTILPTGHWVHVEDADGMVKAVVDAI